MLSAFAYLRMEEMDREQGAIARDVEYAQQRLRLRLLERQEQLMRMARQVANAEIEAPEFAMQAENLINQYPELVAVTWVNQHRQVVAAQASPSAAESSLRYTGQLLTPAESGGTFDLARELRQPVYSSPLAHADQGATVQVHIPLVDISRFNGVVMGEFSVDGLLRFGVPSEVMARYTVNLLDDRGMVLAGTVSTPPHRILPALPWGSEEITQEIPVSPVGNGLLLRAQGYRASQDLVGGGIRLADRSAQCADRVDAGRHLATYPQTHPDSACPDHGNQLPPGHGKLHADRHAGTRHEWPHHLRESGVLQHDGLDRGRAAGLHGPLPVLAGRRP